MIGLLFLAQVMVETLDTRPQAAVPATAFQCSFTRASEDGKPGAPFDLSATIPPAPKGHQPNDYFSFVLGSGDGSPLAGPARANPIHSSDWFRDYQITRRVGTANYVINVKLRREGSSVGYITVYDGGWGEEPFRFDAVGLCTADFEPKTESGQ
jgi:hypothetical protein